MQSMVHHLTLYDQLISVALFALLQAERKVKKRSRRTRGVGAAAAA